MLKSKKLAVFVMLFVLLAPSATPSHAWVVGPLATLFVRMGLGPAMSEFALFATATVGAVVGWLTVNRTSTGTPELAVQLSPDATMPTPAGWGAPGAGGEPTPPSSAAGVSVFTTKIGDAPSGTGGSPTAACAAATSNATTYYGAFLPGRTYTMLSASPTHCAVEAFDHGVSAGTAGAAITGGITCPAGYTSSGGSCLLTTPSAVIKPPDNSCGVKRVGNTFTYDSRDPDCSSPPAQVSVSSSTVSVTAPDGSSLSVSINPSTGVTTITQRSPSSGGGTTTQNSANIGTPSGTGAPVTGINTSVYQGQGDMQGEEPLPGGGDRHCGAPGQPACKIDETGTPSGANVADEGKSALNAMTPSTFGITPWSGSGVSPISGLPSIASSDDCVNPITWVWMGHTLIPDVCAIWSPLKSYLAWLIYALTAVYIWRRTVGSLGAA